jgi:DNA-binding transcriptional LysR family regulator
VNHQLLEHFLHAYEHRSLGRAAAVLGLSQPALSKSIRKLEAQLDVTLFERTTSGIVPTLFADTLARRGRAIRADIRNSVAELQMLRRGEVGEVRMGTAPALAPHFLPKVVAHVAAQQPSITFAIHENLYETLAQEVAGGVLDFALTTLPFSGSSHELQAEALFQDRFVVCCGASHPLAKKRGVQPAELLAWPWITPPRDGLVWQRLVDLFAAQRSDPPRAALETNSAALIKSLLAEGRFLTFVPRQLVVADLLRGEIVELPAAGIVLERSIAILSRPGREYPVAAQLALAACRSVARELAQPGGRRARAGAAKPPA